MRLRSMAVDDNSYQLSGADQINVMIRFREHKKKMPPERFSDAGQGRGLRC